MYFKRLKHELLITLPANKMTAKIWKDTGHLLFENLVDTLLIRTVYNL